MAGAYDAFLERFLSRLGRLRMHVAGEAYVPGGDAEGVRGGGSGEEEGEEDGPHGGTVGAGRLRVR